MNAPCFRLSRRLVRSALPVAVLAMVILLFSGKAYAEPRRGTAGIVRENGEIYYRQEDDSFFTGGYKAVTVDGVRSYYYFQPDGTAYTDGFLEFTQDGKKYFFYFQPDGTAFTGGYKEVTIDGKTYAYYFLANGQGFNTGYKTVMIDGKKCYYYFDSNGRAVTDSIREVSFGSRKAYYLFQSNGAAFTGGYKEIPNGSSTDYYYFLKNGQAFNTGYKLVSIDGATHYFYFESSGKAFTGGLKQVSFGKDAYDYFFTSNGRAKTAVWETVNGKSYYFQSNGRAAKNTFVSAGGKRYYFGADSTPEKGGWFCVGDGYYYAGNDGALAVDTVIQGYKLNSDGKCPTKYRVIECVKAHTKSTMTNQEKIKALFDWLLNNDMSYLRNNDHLSSSWVWKDSWVDDMAADILNQNGGNCFRYASLMGFLIREATGLKVTVYHGEVPGAEVILTPHGWVTVEQDGILYSYDVELKKFGADYTWDETYKRPYSDSKGKLYFSAVGTNLY